MTLCVCGHLSADHLQWDAGESCMISPCLCQEYRRDDPVLMPDDPEYRKTALADRPLSAGVTPEGLAGETVSPSVNEAAERLRYVVRKGMGWPDEHLRLLDAALATERRNTVERIRERVPLEKWQADLLDEVAS